MGVGDGGQYGPGTVNGRIVNAGGELGVRTVDATTRQTDRRPGQVRRKTGFTAMQSRPNRGSSDMSGAG